MMVIIMAKSKAESVALVLTSGTVIDGEIRAKGFKFDASRKEAKRLLARGKAVLDAEDESGEKELKDHTAKELKAILDDYGVEYDDKANKAELVKLIEAEEQAQAE